MFYEFVSHEIMNFLKLRVLENWTTKFKSVISPKSLKKVLKNSSNNNDNNNNNNNKTLNFKF